MRIKWLMYLMLTLHLASCSDGCSNVGPDIKKVYKNILIPGMLKSDDRSKHPEFVDLDIQLNTNDKFRVRANGVINTCAFDVLSSKIKKREYMSFYDCFDVKRNAAMPANYSGVTFGLDPAVANNPAMRCAATSGVRSTAIVPRFLFNAHPGDEVYVQLYGGQVQVNTCNEAQLIKDGIFQFDNLGTLTQRERSLKISDILDTNHHKIPFGQICQSGIKKGTKVIVRGNTITLTRDVGPFLGKSYILKFPNAEDELASNVDISDPDKPVDSFDASIYHNPITSPSTEDGNMIGYYNNSGLSSKYLKGVKIDARLYSKPEISDLDCIKDRDALNKFEPFIANTYCRYLNDYSGGGAWAPYDKFISNIVNEKPECIKISSSIASSTDSSGRATYKFPSIKDAQKSTASSIPQKPVEDNKLELSCHKKMVLGKMLQQIML